MSFTNDMRKAIIAIITTVIASVVLFVMLSLGEIAPIKVRVQALEGGVDARSIQLDAIYKKVDDIHWYLIKKNDRIK